LPEGCLVSGRRPPLEVLGEKNRITVIDDYGQQPTEIQATLAALRVQLRRWCV
jgi:UDP-N-acetylmuramate-alanine ligase